MPSGLVWVDQSLFRKMPLVAPAVDKAISAVMEYEANDAQNAMRTGAPWTDRTGNARQGLFAQAGRTAESHFIVLYHTMPYGIWLELKGGGKYAIIEPTLVPTGQNVMSSLNKVLAAL